MYYIIQENLYREFHFNTMIDHFKKHNLEYEMVPFRPFTDELHFKTDRKDVFFFGSINGSQLALKYGWYPGCFYNDNHDFKVYGEKFREHLLNSDFQILSSTDEVPQEFGNFFFARPSKDTKVFSGQPFSRSAWEEYIQKDDTGILIKQETEILVASLKEVQQEIRCWIVKGKLVTMSQYKIGRRVVYQNQDNNIDASLFVRDMLKIYQPADAFVLDICLHNDEYKIVEINCINCSGFYDMDMSKLLQSLEHNFNKKDHEELNQPNTVSY